VSPAPENVFAVADVSLIINRLVPAENVRFVRVVVVNTEPVAVNIIGPDP
jgi:hypothetical protein